MKVKGSAIETLPLFVREKFGDEGHDKWFDTLSSEARDAFTKKILSSAWYPLKEMFIDPTRQVCDLFYNGNHKGAWENGRYSAEKSLKGIYKVFIRIGSVHFLIKKASTILPTYYEPSRIEIKDVSDNSTILHITQFEEADVIIDNRIGGWIERAMEICGCKTTDIKITKSLAKGDPVTEIHVKWT